MNEKSSNLYHLSEDLVRVSPDDFLETSPKEIQDLLPKDLVVFLQNGNQLDYDPASCEIGAAKLKSLNEISYIELSIDSSDSPLKDFDPNAEASFGGSYCVPAIDLVGHCDDYSPVGILVWFPDLSVYGTYDPDHLDAWVFPDCSWEDIVKDPPKFLNTQWVYPKDFQYLVPWPLFDFVPGQKPKYADGVKMYLVNRDSAFDFVINSFKKEKGYISEVLRRLELGDAEEKTIAGVMHFEGLEVPVNMQKAYRLWEDAEKQGYEGAKINVGVVYYDGIVKPPDTKKAKDLWLHAVEQRYWGAYTNLGVMHHEGKGVEQNGKEAIRLWKKSAKAGFNAAKHNLEAYGLFGVGMKVQQPKSGLVPKKTLLSWKK